ncbi:hypothetical protein GPECTOR_8g292 [Gonium pectorale]|uniref:Uncharacterized protein n=1 Tax=Gonium pectorale TaxID=33097 RepID=A0A150GT04_GONPE|nr:hypothetical protein GPECTOR_8g292 [Gonium pectorale]|eukprot:KXZ52914.1 hypothetical protein GPECTOR_8g292 [Gonium pectorale]
MADMYRSSSPAELFSEGSGSQVVPLPNIRGGGSGLGHGSNGGGPSSKALTAADRHGSMSPGPDDLSRLRLGRSSSSSSTRSDESDDSYLASRPRAAGMPPSVHAGGGAASGAGGAGAAGAGGAQHGQHPSPRSHHRGPSPLNRAHPGRRQQEAQQQQRGGAGAGPGPGSLAGGGGGLRGAGAVSRRGALPGLAGGGGSGGANGRHRSPGSDMLGVWRMRGCLARAMGFSRHPTFSSFTHQGPAPGLAAPLGSPGSAGPGPLPAPLDPAGAFRPGTSSVRPVWSKYSWEPDYQRALLDAALRLPPEAVPAGFMATLSSTLPPPAEAPPLEPDTAALKWFKNSYPEAISTSRRDALAVSAPDGGAGAGAGPNRGAGAAAGAQPPPKSQPSPAALTSGPSGSISPERLPARSGAATGGAGTHSRSNSPDRQTPVTGAAAASPATGGAPNTGTSHNGPPAAPAANGHAHAQSHTHTPPPTAQPVAGPAAPGGVGGAALAAQPSSATGALGAPHSPRAGPSSAVLSAPVPPPPPPFSGPESLVLLRDSEGYLDGAVLRHQETLFSRCIEELAGQVATLCVERGHLIAMLWTALRSAMYAALTDRDAARATAERARRAAVAASAERADAIARAEAEKADMEARNDLLNRRVLAAKVEAEHVRARHQDGQPVLWVGQMKGDGASGSPVGKGGARASCFL